MKSLNFRLRCSEAVARSQENQLPVVLDAVKDYVTMGEIMATMKKVFG